MKTLHTARDLGQTIRDLRPDADPTIITDEWCRESMHDLGVTRYEDVDDDIIDAISNRVDFAGPTRVVLDERFNATATERVREMLDAVAMTDADWNGSGFTVETGEHTCIIGRDSDRPTAVALLRRIFAVLEEEV